MSSSYIAAQRSFDDIPPLDKDWKLKFSKDGIRNDAAMRESAANHIIYDRILQPKMEAARNEYKQCVSALVPGHSLAECEGHKTALQSRYLSMARWVQQDCKHFYSALQANLFHDDKEKVNDSINKMELCLSSKETFYLLRGVQKGHKFPVFDQTTQKPVDMVATKLASKRADGGWVAVDDFDGKKEVGVTGKLSQYSDTKLGISVPSKWLETKGRLHGGAEEDDSHGHH